MSLPRPLCECELCKRARKDNSLKRNSSCAYIPEIKTLIDCPEDIADSLNRHNVTKVNNLLITHWHPDHTFGLRLLLEANYDFVNNKAEKQINIYIGKKVYETLKQRYPALDYQVNVLKLAKINIIEDGDILEFGDAKIKVAGYTGKESEWYGYLFENNGKKLLYTPCDTINFKEYSKYTELDYWVTETGIISDTVENEIYFPDMIKRIKEIQPKKTILTHIEELELKLHGEDALEKRKKEYQDININIAYDGMEIEL